MTYQKIHLLGILSAKSMMEASGIAEMVFSDQITVVMTFEIIIIKL